MARKDHWLLAEPDPSTLTNARLVCGVPWSSMERNPASADGYWSPLEVGCPDCKATALYKETITTIEIAYDGNDLAWWNARDLAFRNRGSHGK